MKSLKSIIFESQSTQCENIFKPKDGDTIYMVDSADNKIKEFTVLGISNKGFDNISKAVVLQEKGGKTKEELHIFKGEENKSALVTSRTICFNGESHTITYAATKEMLEEIINNKELNSIDDKIAELEKSKKAIQDKINKKNENQ